MSIDMNRPWGKLCTLGKDPTNKEGVHNCLTELYARTPVALKLQICDISSMVTSSVTVGCDSEAFCLISLIVEGAASAKLSAAEGVWPPKSCGTILFAKVYNLISGIFSRA